jgi:hypothetical protein
LKITVELLGRSVPLTVPTKVEMHGDELTASGEFEVTHTMLGMMPFTVALGALQVADNMKFVYRSTPSPRRRRAEVAPRHRGVARAVCQRSRHRALGFETAEVTAIPCSLTVT